MVDTCPKCGRILIFKRVAHGYTAECCGRAHFKPEMKGTPDGDLENEGEGDET